MSDTVTLKITNAIGDLTEQLDKIHENVSKQVAVLDKHYGSPREFAAAMKTVFSNIAADHTRTLDLMNRLTLNIGPVSPEAVAELRKRMDARMAGQEFEVIEDDAYPAGETEMFSCCGHMVLPCPFCGSRDLDVGDDGEGGVQVSCCREGCAAIGPGSCNYVRQDNIQAWNTRWNGGGQIDLEPIWVRSGRDVSK